MANTWLEIPNPELDQAQIAQQIQANLAEKAVAPNMDSWPEDMADLLWQQLLGQDRTNKEASAQLGLQMQDCDIVPRTYTIGWQTPIIGPIYALIRRIINGEIRRFLGPSLEQQSALNRQLLRLIVDLQAENQQLKQEITHLNQKSQ